MPSTYIDVKYTNEYGTTFHWSRKFKIGSFDKFISKRRDNCPYFKFYYWVTKHKLGGLPEGLQPNVSAFWITKNDEKKLDKIIREWAKNYTSAGIYKDKYFDSQVGMLKLDMGPCTLQKDDLLASAEFEDGYVYMRGDEDWFKPPRS